MKSRAAFPHLSIEYEREQIPVDRLSPEMVPDEKWRYIDKQGHGHFWEGKELPTLKWVITGTEWVGDEFEMTEYDVGEYRCRLCDEIVAPERRPHYGPSHVPGPATVTMTIGDRTFILSEEQFADALDALVQYLEVA